MRVLVDSDFTITSPVFVGADGETPSDLDSGVPTVTVTNAAGTSLSAPTAVAGSANDGKYTAKLTAATHTLDLDILTVTWTGTAGSHVQKYTQIVEVVGAHFASISELREITGLGDATKVPTLALIEARDEFAAIAEQYLQASYVPRLSTETLVGDDTDELPLRWPKATTLRSITLDGVAGTTSDYDLTTWGTILATATSFASTSPPSLNIAVSYEHGYSTPPEALRRACREYVKSVCTAARAGVSRDVISQSPDGAVRYSTPNVAMDRPTGFLEVDRLLNSVRPHATPGIA